MNERSCVQPLLSFCLFCIILNFLVIDTYLKVLILMIANAMCLLHWKIVKFFVALAYHYPLLDGFGQPFQATAHFPLSGRID